MIAGSWRHTRLCYLRPALAFMAILVPVLAGCGGRPPPGTGATGTVAAEHPLGLPRYYAVYRTEPGPWAPDAGDEVIEIRDSATGRVHDVFDMTGKLGGQPGVHFAGGNPLAAEADQRTFFVDFPLWDPRAHTTSGARIYRFQVTGSGHVAGVTRVGSIPAAIGYPTAMAVSPDGSQLALAAQYQLARPEVMVVNLGSGAATQWRGGLAGQQYQNVISQLSWAADGHTLAFAYTHSESAPTAPSADYSQWTTEVRTLSTDAPGGSLAAGRLVQRWLPSKSRFIDQAAISPDGRSVTVAVQQGPIYKYSQMPANVEVVQISVQYGRQLRVLYAGPAGNSTSPFLRGDGNGHWLLTANWKLGWIGGGRLHDLPPGQDGTVTDVAW